jgi:hypothetical protein
LDVHVRDCGRDVGKRAIPILQEVGGSMVFGELVPQLLGGPRRGRMFGHRHVQSRKVTVGTTKKSAAITWPT